MAKNLGKRFQQVIFMEVCINFSHKYNIAYTQQEIILQSFTFSNKCSSSIRIHCFQWNQNNKLVYILSASQMGLLKTHRPLPQP